MIQFFFLDQRSGISMKMPESTDELKKNHANSECQVREDSEYVRLVIPSELRKCEPDILESQGQEREGSRIWWVKTTIWCSITVIILLIFVKWGLPFLVKKVGITCLVFKLDTTFLAVFCLTLQFANYSDWLMWRNWIVEILRPLAKMS